MRIGLHTRLRPDQPDQPILRHPANTAAKPRHSIPEGNRPTVSSGSIKQKPRKVFRVAAGGVRGSGSWEALNGYISWVTDQMPQSMFEEYQALAIDRVGIDSGHNWNATYQALLKQRLFAAARHGLNGRMFQEIHRSELEALYLDTQKRADDQLRYWVDRKLVRYVTGTLSLPRQPRFGPFRMRVASDEVNRYFSASNLILGLGSTPNHLDTSTLKISGAGAGEIKIETSDEFLRRDKHPKRIVIVGGGVIALEFASIMKLYGHEVTVLQRDDVVLNGFDQEAVKYVREELEKDGTVRLLTGCALTALHRDSGKKTPTSVTFTDKSGQEHTLLADELVQAIGRHPNTSGFGWENVGISQESIRKNCGVPVNECFEPINNKGQSIHGLFALGDLVGKRITETVTPFKFYPVLRTIFDHLPNIPRFYRFMDGFFKHKFGIFRHEEQSLAGERTIIAAEDQGRQVIRYILNNRERPRFDVNAYHQNIYSAPEIALFGRVHDKASSDAVVVTTIYGNGRALAEPNHHCEGFLKIAYNPSEGTVIAAGAVGPLAHDLILLTKAAAHPEAFGHLDARFPERFPRSTAIAPTDIIYANLRQANNALIARQRAD